MMDDVSGDGSIPFHEFAHEVRAVSSRPKFPFERLSSIKPILNGSWLIKNLLPSAGLAVIYGPPGSGKSFVAISAGLHVAAGRQWAGRKVRPVCVIYIAAEGQAGFRKRVFAALQEFGFSLEIPFVLITVAPNLGGTEGDTAILVREIREQAGMLGFSPGLIILDTLARTIVGADENSGRDMGIFIANADTIGRELKACVVAVHHTGKSQDKGMRGSSAVHGATDTEWEITADETGKRLRIAKMKDAEHDVSLMFRLQVVEVGIDEDGDPVTTCVAAVSEEPEHHNVPVTKPPKKVTGQKAEFIKAVAMAIDGLGEIMPVSNYTPLKQKGVKRQALAHYAEQFGFTEGATSESRKTCAIVSLRPWPETAFSANGENGFGFHDRHRNMPEHSGTSGTCSGVQPGGTSEHWKPTPKGWWDFSCSACSGVGGSTGADRAAGVGRPTHRRSGLSISGLRGLPTEGRHSYPDRALVDQLPDLRDRVRMLHACSIRRGQVPPPMRFASTSWLAGRS